MPSYERKSFLALAADIAEETGDDIVECIQRLDDTFVSLALTYDRLDLGLLEESFATEVQQMPCSWENFEFAFAKASRSADELLKNEISKEQAIKQRLIPSYDPRTTSAITDQEIAELSKLADT